MLPISTEIRMLCAAQILKLELDMKISFGDYMVTFLLLKNTGIQKDSIY